MQFWKEALIACTVKNENKKVYFLFRESSYAHDCRRQASAPAPPWNLLLLRFFLFLHFNSNKTTLRRKKQQNYTNLPLFCFSLSNMHKTIRLFASPNIRSATRSRSDKIEKNNSDLLHKKIQLFCLSKSIYKKIVKYSYGCLLHK
jgi:hypothetical protein